MPKNTNIEIISDWLSRFEAFRASLSEENQELLDLKLVRWRDAIKSRRPCQFSLQDAKELFMALVEMGG